MYGSLDISTSALLAQRTRMNVISANIAQKDVLLNESGEYEPFRRRIATLAAGTPNTIHGLGVHVSEIAVDDSPFIPRYEPGSPFADSNGYVYYPNVDPIVEQLNAMEAARSYEANIAAIEATKSMISIALQMIA